MKAHILFRLITEIAFSVAFVCLHTKRSIGLDGGLTN